jgi:hypothetical protein
MGLRACLTQANEAVNIRQAMGRCFIQNIEAKAEEM